MPTNLSSTPSARKPFYAFLSSVFFAAFAHAFYLCFFVRFISQVFDISPVEKSTILQLSFLSFFLPFFFFSGYAGKITDKLSRPSILRVMRLCLLAFSIPLFLALHYGWDYFLILGIFVLSFFLSFTSPARSALLSDIVPKKSLTGSLLSFQLLRLLAFVLAFTAVFFYPFSSLLPFVFLFSGAIAISFLLSFFLPTATKFPALPPFSHPFRDAKDVLKTMNVFPYFLGYTFFASASLFSALFIFGLIFPFEKPQLFVFFFSGIFAGLLILLILFRKKPFRHTLVPLSIFAQFALSLSLAVGGFYAFHPLYILGAHVFALALVSTLSLFSIEGLFHQDVPPSEKGHVFAAKNILMSFLFLLFSCLVFALFQFGFSLPTTFYALSAILFVFSFWTIPLLPDAVLEAVARLFFHRIYGFKIEGLDHYKQAGKKALIVANHTSYIDAVLLALFLPDKPTFVLSTEMAGKFWVKPFLRFVKVVTVDPFNPMIVRTLIDLVNKNKRVVIFPEGRVTVTGSLMKVYDGTGLIADRTGADIIPIQISGAQFSIFSRFGHKLRKRPSVRITLRIFPARKIKVPKEIQGRSRRHSASDMIFEIMADMLFYSRPIRKTLIEQYLETMSFVGRDFPVVDDTDRKPLTYSQLLVRSFVVASLMRPLVHKGEFIGLLLPNLKVNVVAFFATHILGAVPSMLNYSTGVANLRSCIKAAQIKVTFTSRQFVKKAEIEHLIDALHSEGVKVFYLEDFQSAATLPVKLKALYAARFPKRFVEKVVPESPAVILFTSGSEGVPKGVALSHINLMANIDQIETRIDLTPTDLLFTALPMFHSFGLTIGVLFPIMSGVKVFIYPSPLHYRVVPEYVYDINATIMLATDTFLYGYARMAHAYDFFSMRYIFAGGERIKDETFKLCTEKLGIRVFEGYGATEASPLICINTSLYNRRGSVGKIIPGMEYRLESVPGIDQGKRLFVKGPNVMLGYLKADNPGVIQPLVDGWYDTGDIVNVSDGFISITGRAKRFAKVGGEMVSLPAVEEAVLKCFPGDSIAVVTVPDPKKGEQLVLVQPSTRPKLTRDIIAAAFKEREVSELFIPRYIHVLDALPVMGTGKIDYIKLQELIKEIPL